MIESVSRIVNKWEISIIDNGINGRTKENKNRYNYLKNDNTCKFLNCKENISMRRMSGLCDNHKEHCHDLYLNVKDNEGNNIGAPAHKEIIDALLEWSQSRNFGLLPFFSDLSFNILGNVPDVTILASEVCVNDEIIIPKISNIFDSLINVIERYFPLNNNSSYQPLATNKGEIPAIVLAYTFVGLLICEEANRADRWYCRMVIKDESKTTQLGAAMAIAYFATRIFPWGVEMNKAARNLTR